MDTLLIWSNCLGCKIGYLAEIANQRQVWEAAAVPRSLFHTEVKALFLSGYPSPREQGILLLNPYWQVYVCVCMCTCVHACACLPFLSLSLRIAILIYNSYTMCTILYFFNCNYHPNQFGIFSSSLQEMVAVILHFPPVSALWHNQSALCLWILDICVNGIIHYVVFCDRLLAHSYLMVLSSPCLSCISISFLS